MGAVMVMLAPVPACLMELTMWAVMVELAASSFAEAAAAVIV